MKENQYRKEAGELVESYRVVQDLAELFKTFVSNYQLLVEVLEQEADLKPSQVVTIQNVVDRKQEELQAQVIKYGESIRFRDHGGPGS